MRKKQCNRLTLLILVMIFTTLSISAQSFNEEISAIADVIVDINGSGDYTTVQEAINSIPDNNDTDKIIFVKNGIYYKKLFWAIKKQM